MSRRTLVFAPASLADALPRLPVFAALARSGRAVIGLFREGQAAFEPTLLRLRKENTPDDLALPIAVPWGRDGMRAKTLAGLGCQEAVLLEPGLGAAWLALRSGAAERWGYGGGLAGGLGGLLLNRRVKRPAGFDERPYAARDQELLAALGALSGPSGFAAASSDLAAEAWPPESDRRLDVPRGWKTVGRDRLELAKIDPRRQLIGIHAGASGGSTVDGWPRAAFEELIRGLRRERSDYQFVLLAMLDDLWQAVLLFEKTGKIHPVIGPDLPFTGLLATLTNLDLLIAADSTLLHLAGALGVPTLGLYEQASALRRPPGSRHRALERRPLRTLPPEEVQAAALELLA